MSTAGWNVTSKRTLLRILERDREAYLAIIREQNDRIMELAGRPWNVPPSQLLERPEEDEEVEEPQFVHADHWPE